MCNPWIDWSNRKVNQYLRCSFRIVNLIQNDGGVVYKNFSDRARRIWGVNSVLMESAHSSESG